MGIKTRAFILSVFVVLAASVLLLVILSLIRSGKPTRSPEYTQTSSSGDMVAITPTSIWFGLLGKTPHPIKTPLPEPESTILDGTYTKFDPDPPQWWACRRCADYRPAGGIWKIQFDKGVMRIYYLVTGWRSLASYTISADHLYIFNDSYCPEEVGEYLWKSDQGDLSLDVIDDPCSIQLRGVNFHRQRRWHIADAPGRCDLTM